MCVHQANIYKTRMITFNDDDGAREILVPQDFCKTPIFLSHGIFYQCIRKQIEPLFNITTKWWHFRQFTAYWYTSLNVVLNSQEWDLSPWRLARILLQLVLFFSGTLCLLSAGHWTCYSILIFSIVKTIYFNHYIVACLHFHLSLSVADALTWREWSPDSLEIALVCVLFWNGGQSQ